MASRILRRRHLADLTKCQTRLRVESGGAILIDVRRFEELKVGLIETPPGQWIHIPLNELEEAIELDNDDFAAKFDAQKPNVNDELIFYCMKGVRSKKAAMYFEQNGYQNVSNYLGGWWEWNDHWTKDEWLVWFEKANYPVKQHWLENRFPSEDNQNS